MTDSSIDARFFLASAVGFGLIVWGVGVALFAPRGWLGRGAVAGIGAAVALGGVALFVPAYLSLAVSMAATVALGVTLLGSGRVQSGLTSAVRLLVRPRVFGAVVAVAAGGGLVVAGWWHDHALQNESDATLAEAVAAPPVTSPAAVAARTDRGTAIPLQVPSEPFSPADAADREKRSVVMANLSGKWIRRGPADDICNCHGWVFAGGKFNLGGRHVDAILADNGYSTVTDPAAGDVCVYRDTAGEVAHTAVVRAVLPDGGVLVEGKWGRLGVYLHAAGDSCYGTTFAFHRTCRDGHLLAGLDGSADHKAPTDPAP